MKKAICAVSGDPIHNGHIDIVKRTARVFDKVILSLGNNPDKKYLFNLEERLEMARRALSTIPNVDVVPFEGLLVDYAYEQGASVIVKGIRNANDFDYENILHLVGESQELGVDTYILFARPELIHVSSTTIKALQKEEGFIHHYVPLIVKQALESKLSNQYILGVTGEIGSGASEMTSLFREIGRRFGISLHAIDLDDLGNQILEERTEPSYSEVRKRIIQEFGTNVGNPDGTINRKALGEIVYHDYHKLNRMNEIMDTPLMVRLRKEMRGKTGLILVNAALMAESNMMYMCNNNVLLITCHKRSQEKRLKERGFDKRQIQRRLASQYNEKEKREKIQTTIARENVGNLWVLDYTNNALSRAAVQTFEEITSYFRLEGEEGGVAGDA